MIGKINLVSIFILLISLFASADPNWVKRNDMKLLQDSTPRPNVVVASDGSGHYTTVNAAIVAARNWSSSGKYIIYVKRGLYVENVEISMANVMLIGDGIGETVISGNRSVDDGYETSQTATVVASGNGFLARGITFRNSAGPTKHQAIAFLSASNHSVVYRCSFEGYQDTLCANQNLQFYRECDIYGTVDFIFGFAAAVFQKCNIYVRNPPNGTSVITAQGRSSLDDKGGFSIQNCRVTGAPDLQSSAKTYLGRPWKIYSRTVFLKTYLDSLIDPAGWMPWNGSVGLDTLYYGEYGNMGPGALTTKRVNWTGYRVITNDSEAAQFTPREFIDGDSWIPSTNVPYTPGL